MNETYWRELLLSAQQGCPEAFGKLYHEYLEPKLYSLALNMLKVPHEAENLVQDVFLYLFEKQRYLSIYTKSLQAFESYILKTVRHRCLDELKKQKTTQFWIRADTLETLRYLDVPSELLERLQSLSLEKPVGKARFLTLMRETLGEVLTAPLESLLLRHSQQHISNTIAFSDELLNVIPANSALSEEEYEFAEQELQRLMLAVQEKLGDANWELLKKKYHQGKTFREISEESATPISTLQARCKKSIQVIRSDGALYAHWFRHLAILEKASL